MPVTVGFQTQYEICALVFLLAVTSRFFFVRRFPSRLNSLYGIILMCAIADIVLDVVGSYTILFAHMVPVWLNYLINTSFYALQIVLPALMMTYVIYGAGQSYRHSRWLKLLLLPILLFFILLLLNPWTKHIFYLSEINGRLFYCRGPLFPFLYIDTAFYIICTGRLVFVYKAHLEKRQSRTILAFLAILVVAMLIQYLFPDVLLTGVAIALAIQMMFFTLQNPDDMLDHISNAFNYNAMVFYLDAAVLRSEPLRVVTVDVGGIRRINSSFGLLIGNKVFSLVGDFFHALPGDNWVFRMVGTRFFLVIDGDVDFISTVEHIRDRFNQGWDVDGNRMNLVATIRYFNAQRIFSSAEEVIALIDETYAGISSGKWGHCEPIDQTALETSHRKTLIESSLRSALQTGEGLTLHYQPIYNVQKRCFTSAEALLRFQCPQLGAVSPMEFIPIAEKCGLIFPIDDYVIQMACKYLKTHNDFEYLEINLSSAEFFCDPAERMHAIVKRQGVDPRRICFEVTETAADAYPAMLSEFMNRMIEYGYRFALDDFGTGYSNITKVAQLPFYIAKIDKILLSDEKKIITLFESVANMFANIGIKTVVEGVETENQVRLVASQVDFVQGYYYARPMPESELRGFLDRAGQGAVPVA